MNVSCIHFPCCIFSLKKKIRIKTGHTLYKIRLYITMPCGKKTWQKKIRECARRKTFFQQKKYIYKGEKECKCESRERPRKLCLHTTNEICCCFGCVVIYMHVCVWVRVCVLAARCNERRNQNLLPFSFYCYKVLPLRSKPRRRRRERRKTKARRERKCCC